MDLERAVDDFVSRGKALFVHLRSEGEALSDLGLKILLNQLHILNVEATRLKQVRLSAHRRRTQSMSSKKSVLPTNPALEKTHLIPACTHGRLIDYFLNADGQRTSLLHCLECGAVFQDPLLKPEG
jgi:hypothetical protein